MKRIHDTTQSRLFPDQALSQEMKAIVRFLPSQKRIHVAPNTLLLEAATLAGLPVAQSCGSELVCGWCKVKIESGEENLSLAGREEVLLQEREKYSPDERASCAARILTGDVTISATYW